MSAATAPAPARLCRVAGRDTWHIRHEGRRFSTGETEREAAQRHLADYLVELARPAAVSAAVEHILPAYLADRRSRRKPGADRLMWAHKPLARLLGQVPAAHLNDARCIAYAATRRAEGIADATIRTELQALRAAVRWHMPDGAPRIEMPARPVSRDRWLTRDESARLVAACRHSHLRLFVLLALHTAARSSAILGLTWDRVDLAQRRIDFREPGKAASRKRKVAVPVNDTLAVALIEARRVATSGYVVEFNGQPCARIIHGFSSAAKRADLVDVTPHTCRHTAATWMAQAGVPLWQVAGMLGHSDAAMVAATYGHHHPDHLADAARALNGNSARPSA